MNRAVPKRQDKIVLHSTIDVEDGVLAVVEELQKRGRTATILLERPSRAAEVERYAGSTVRTVAKRSLRGVLEYLTARFVMTTENLYGDRQSPASQVVVNLWHGEAPSGKVIAQFAPGQGGGEKADRPVLCWLPSFRSGSWEGRTRRDVAESYPGVPFPPEDLRRLDAWLVKHDATVVVKLHPHDVATLSGDFQAIRVMTQEEMQEHGLTMYTMLPAFDGLLTDVSSIWIDYLLLNKPMVFAFPDIDEYRSSRGLSLEPYEDWVPGPFVREIDGLIAALDDLVHGRDPMARERGLARSRFHQYRDDGSTGRLLDGLGILPR